MKSKNKIKRPPLGVMPKWLWEEKRRGDLFNAILRYCIKDKKVPKVWIKEYLKLLKSNEMSNYQF